MIRKEALLLEIKESTKILNSENNAQKLIAANLNLETSNLLALDFLEDQFTEELIWYLCNKTSKAIYECIYNPITETISLSQINDMNFLEKNCRSISVLDEYLNLSEAELALLH